MLDRLLHSPLAKALNEAFDREFPTNCLIECVTGYARLIVMRTNMLIAAYDIYCITYYSNSNSNSNQYGTISKNILIVIQTNLVPHVRIL